MKSQAKLWRLAEWHAKSENDPDFHYRKPLERGKTTPAGAWQEDAPITDYSIYLGDRVLRLPGSLKGLQPGSTARLRQPAFDPPHLDQMPHGHPALIAASLVLVHELSADTLARWDRELPESHGVARLFPAHPVVVDDAALDAALLKHNIELSKDQKKPTGAHKRVQAPQTAAADDEPLPAVDALVWSTEPLPVPPLPPAPPRIAGQRSVAALLQAGQEQYVGEGQCNMVDMSGCVSLPKRTGALPPAATEEQRQRALKGGCARLDHEQLGELVAALRAEATKPNPPFHSLSTMRSDVALFQIDFDLTTAEPSFLDVLQGPAQLMLHVVQRLWRDRAIEAYIATASGWDYRGGQAKTAQ